MIYTIEYFTRGKTRNELLNEDGIVIKNNFVAVIDGATSKSRVTFEGLSGGKFGKLELSDYPRASVIVFNGERGEVWNNGNTVEALMQHDIGLSQ